MDNNNLRTLIINDVNIGKHQTIETLKNIANIILASKSKIDVIFYLIDYQEDEKENIINKIKDKNMNYLMRSLIKHIPQDIIDNINSGDDFDYNTDYTTYDNIVISDDIRLFRKNVINKLRNNL